MLSRKLLASGVSRNKEDPFGQLSGVSAELSSAIIASAFRCGTNNGSSGMLLLVVPASNKVMYSSDESYNKISSITVRLLESAYWIRVWLPIGKCIRDSGNIDIRVTNLVDYGLESIRNEAIRVRAIDR